MSTAPEMSVSQTLHAALDAAHQMLEATMADVDADVADRSAPGNANRIGASYAHAVLAEDAVVNAMLRDQAPLWTGEWAGRTGTDRPIVISGAPFPGAEAGDLGAWYREVRVALDACRAYAQAVYAASDVFLETADEATL